MLYLLLLGGRRLTQRLNPVRGRVQMAMGAVMVLVAIAMTANWDVRFQTEIASALPRFLVNPTESIEKSKAISTPLADVSQHGTPVVPADQLNQPVSLQTYGQAPDFTGTQDWFNTPGGESLSMSDLRGKVVLVDFWTYTCINCIRTLPYLEAWQQRYGRQGFTVVGVHSPEFPFEKDAGNVQAAIRQNHLTYPVAQDNDLATWDAWGNQYWPADYLVDAQGNVREAHFGEGDYAETERAIRTLAPRGGPHQARRGGARECAGAVGGREDARDVSGRGSRPGVGHSRSPRASGLRRRARPALGQPVRLRGPLGDHRRGRDLGGGRRDRHGVRRAPRLPRPGLARPGSPRPGAARRQADPREARRRRRPQWPCRPSRRSGSTAWSTFRPSRSTGSR